MKIDAVIAENKMSKNTSLLLLPSKCEILITIYISTYLKITHLLPLTLHVKYLSVHLTKKITSSMKTTLKFEINKKQHIFSSICASKM